MRDEGNRRPRAARAREAQMTAAVACFYAPLSLSFVLMSGASLCWHFGGRWWAERVLGPATLAVVGWTFAGSMLAALRYGWVIVPDGWESGWRRGALRAVHWAVVAVGAGLAGAGAWLMVRGAS